jgi:hypothetical protein
MPPSPTPFPPPHDFRSAAVTADVTAPATAPAADPETGIVAAISAVQEDIVRLSLTEAGRGRLVKNEVVYIRPARAPQERLKAEILRVLGDSADAQVFESTRGVGPGDPVEQTGSSSLSIRLGPGMLGQVYDGLQNPLEALAVGYGTCSAARRRGVAARPESEMVVHSDAAHRGHGARRRWDRHGSRKVRFSTRSWCPSISTEDRRADWIQQGSSMTDRQPPSRASPRPPRAPSAR